MATVSGMSTRARSAPTTKVHRIVLLVVDDDNLGTAGVKNVIENVRYPNHCIAPLVISCETKEVEWTDEHPLNNADTMRQVFAEMFGS